MINFGFNLSDRFVIINKKRGNYEKI